MPNKINYQVAASKQYAIKLHVNFFYNSFSHQLFVYFVGTFYACSNRTAKMCVEIFNCCLRSSIDGSCSAVPPPAVIKHNKPIPWIPAHCQQYGMPRGVLHQHGASTAMQGLQTLHCSATAGHTEHLCLEWQQLIHVNQYHDHVNKTKACLRS